MGMNAEAGWMFERFEGIPKRRLLLWLCALLLVSAPLLVFTLEGCGEGSGVSGGNQGRPASELLAEARNQGLPVFLEFYSPG